MDKGNKNNVSYKKHWTFNTVNSLAGKQICSFKCFKYQCNFQLIYALLFSYQHMKVLKMFLFLFRASTISRKRNNIIGNGKTKSTNLLVQMFFNFKLLLYSMSRKVFICNLRFQMCIISRYNISELRDKNVFFVKLNGAFLKN